MNILIAIPRYNATDQADYDYPFPLGLAYISTILKKAGYNVDCLNLNHLDGYVRDLIAEQLDTKKYDIVCTGNNAFGYRLTELMINTCRDHPSSPRVILGGPIITTEPELVFRELKPDFGVIGEGEQTIVELLATIRDKTDMTGVNGIIFADGEGKVVKTEKRKPIMDLDTIPLPDFASFGFVEQLDNTHPNKSYYTNFFNHPRVYPLLASRSCPYQCTFCYHDTMYRKRSMENIMEELETMVRRYRINILMIYDDCFSADKERLYEFCRKIKKLSEKVGWDIKWTCQLRVESVDKKLLDTMKDAGCGAISYGFESYSAKVLKSMKKYVTPEQIDRAFSETIKAKISVQGNFIFGDVAETVETAKETLEYWKKKCAGQFMLGFIQPYPGSKIYEHCIEKGIIKDKLDFIKNNVGFSYLNMTDKMADKELDDLKKEVMIANSRYVRYVIPDRIKKEKKGTFRFMATCPFCDEKSVYKNCKFSNRVAFGFFMICRNCYKRYYVVSLLYKIGYKCFQLPVLRDMIAYYLHVKNSPKKLGMSPISRIRSWFASS
ncbi:B12-binding domain-containing radical SAM protein [Nanoarchaeota archaeon]